MPAVITGSNILNFEEWLKLCIHSVRCDIVGKTENSVTITATSDDCYTDTYGSGGEGYGLKISVNAGKTYILSWDSSGEGTQRIIVFAGESTVITESAESPLVFTVPSGYTYIKFRFGIQESGKTITFSNAQIMETTTYYYEQKSNSYPTLIDEAPLIEIPNSPVPYNTFKQNNEVNDGYPYIQDTEYCISVPKEPYPICAFVQDGVTNDGYPYITNTDRYLNVVKEPYPDGIFIQRKKQYPKLSNLKPINDGAFCHASNLRAMKIPRSVKYIGETAFTHTTLTEVTIATDCVFYPTSFPEGCKINFY